MRRQAKSLDVNFITVRLVSASNGLVTMWFAEYNLQKPVMFRFCFRLNNRFHWPLIPKARFPKSQWLDESYI